MAHIFFPRDAIFLASASDRKLQQVPGYRVSVIAAMSVTIGNGIKFLRLRRISALNPRHWPKE